MIASIDTLPFDDLVATLMLLDEDKRREAFYEHIAQRPEYNLLEKDILWHYVQALLSSPGDTIPEWSRSLPTPYSPSR